MEMSMNKYDRIVLGLTLVATLLLVLGVWVVEDLVFARVFIALGVITFFVEAPFAYLGSQQESTPR